MVVGGISSENLTTIEVIPFYGKYDSTLSIHTSWYVLYIHMMNPLALPFRE